MAAIKTFRRFDELLDTSGFDGVADGVNYVLHWNDSTKKFEAQALNRTDPPYMESGTLALTPGQLDVSITFVYAKANATYVPLQLAVADSSDPPQDIRAVFNPTSRTTTGFTCKLSAAPNTSNCTLFWNVAILGANQPGTNVRYTAIGNRTAYASGISGLTLDSNVLTGGGTNATTNTFVLNAALDDLAAAGGGTLILDGAALINGPLTPGNNTTIYCPTASNGVYLADGSHCEMLRNKLFAQTGLKIAPNRPGTYNKNIRIVGGTWNGNFDNQSSALGGVNGNFFTCGFFFCGVNNLTLDSVTILNARVFAALMAYLGDPTVIRCTAKWDNFHTSVSNDGFHYWGPITGVNTIRNVHGVNGGDDFVALSYAEAPGYTGDTHLFDVDPAGVNTIVDGVTIENGVGPVVIHGVTWNGFDSIITSVGNITIRNVTASFNSTPATAFTLYADGRWDRLVCENWKIKYPATVTGAGVDRNVRILPYNTSAITEFRNWQVSGATDDPYDFILFGGNSALHSLILSDFHVIKTTGGAPAGSLFGMSSGSDPSAPGVDILTANDCEVSGFAGLIFNGRPAGKLASVHADNNTLNGAALFSPGSQAPGSLSNGSFSLDYLTGKPSAPFFMELQTDVRAGSVNATAQWLELQSFNFAELYGQLWRLNISGAGNATQTRFSVNAGNNVSGTFNSQADVISFFTGGGVVVGTSTTNPGLGVIKADAGFSPPHLADSAALNDTFFYSTTTGKPSYKDSSGTVTALPPASIFATVYNSTAQSVPNATWIILTFDSEGSDTSAIHSTSSNTGRLTCPVTGRYLIEGGAAFAINSTGGRAIGIGYNGGAGTSFVKLESKNAVSGNETQFSVIRVLDMTAGDFVTLQAYQDSGGALNVVSSDYYSMQFTMTRLP